MISIRYRVRIPKKYSSSKFAGDISGNLMKNIHKHLREELKSRENYHFQQGNISPWGRQEEPLESGWHLRRVGSSILCVNNLLKASDIYNGTEPYCSRYIKSGRPKIWNGPRKMHFWYQGKEMFRYCVGGIPRGGYASNQLHYDIENAAKFGIQKGRKAFTKYMKSKYG